MNILCFGAGDFADSVTRIFNISVIKYFVSDEKFITSDCTEVLNEDIINLYPPSEYEFIIAMGYDSLDSKAEVFNSIKRMGYSITSLIHEYSYVSNDVSIGAGNIVFPGCVLEPGVSLGDGNVLWSNVTVCHDVTVGNMNFFSSGTIVGGYTGLGSRNFLCFNSVISSRLKLGDNNIIGANSFLNSSISSGHKYLGSPATKRIN